MLTPYPLPQVAQLDTQLLSERVKYEQQSEGATKNHIRELTNLKKLHDNKVLELTAEIDQLKEERTQVGGIKSHLLNPVRNCNIILRLFS